MNLEGGHYSSLDPELQAAFTHYLRERGVDQDLAQFVCSAVGDKEEQEYQRWLADVAAFVES